MINEFVQVGRQLAVSKKELSGIEASMLIVCGCVFVGALCIWMNLTDKKWKGGFLPGFVMIGIGALFLILEVLFGG